MTVGRIFLGLFGVAALTIVVFLITAFVGAGTGPGGGCGGG